MKKHQLEALYATLTPEQLEERLAANSPGDDRFLLEQAWVRKRGSFVEQLVFDTDGYIKDFACGLNIAAGLALGLGLASLLLLVLCF